MSLINEMLQDLEARGSGGTPADVRVTPARRTPARRWPFIAASVVTLLLSAVVTMLLWPKMFAAPETPRSSTEVPLTVTEAVPPAEADVVSVQEQEVVSTVATDNETPVEAARDASAVVAVANTQDVPPETAPVANVALAETANPASNEPARAARVPAAEPAPTETLIVKRHEPTAAEKAARAGREGFAALRRGDFATAARLLQELVAMEPANDEAREGLVIALSRQGRIAEADGFLLDGLALGAAPARFAKLRARTQAARGELDAALDSLAIAVPAIVQDPEYHALKGALAQQAGRHEIAVETYSALTAFDPANGTWHAGLGMALDNTDRKAEARVAYEHAVSAGGLEPALLAHVQRRLATLDGAEK